MVDPPSRQLSDPDEDGAARGDSGWGSPVSGSPMPAGYGSLHDYPASDDGKSSNGHDGGDSRGGSGYGVVRRDGVSNRDGAGHYARPRAAAPLPAGVRLRKAWAGVKASRDALMAMRTPPPPRSDGAGAARPGSAPSAPSAAERNPWSWKPGSPFAQPGPERTAPALPASDPATGSLPSVDSLTPAARTAQSPIIRAPIGPAGPAPAGPTPSAAPIYAVEPAPAVTTATAAGVVPDPMARVGPTRRTVKHLDVVSVAKVSAVFYLLILVVVVVASILLWYAADAFGTLTSIEKSIRTLFDLKTYTLHVGTVAMYMSAAGAVLAVAGTFVNVLAAIMYNLICDLVGGVRVVLDDDTAPPARPIRPAVGRRSSDRPGRAHSVGSGSNGPDPRSRSGSAPRQSGSGQPPAGSRARPIRPR